MVRKLLLAAVVIGAMPVSAPHAQARDMFGGKMYDFQRNAGNRVNDSWNRQRDNSWDRNSRNEGWGSGNSSRNWLRGGGRDNYSRQDSWNNRSSYGGMGSQNKRLDPNQMQKQWEKKWEKQVKQGEDYHKQLQKKYEKITKQNSPIVSGSRRAANRYGY